IRGANSLEAAGPDELSFVSNKKSASAAADSRAGCLIVSREFDVAGDWSLIRVDDQRGAFARALAKLYPEERPTPFIHASASMTSCAYVASDCYIGTHAVIGSNARIGSGCVIYDGAHVGDHAVIGEQTTLYPHVMIYSSAQIGARVILHAGCVIGADG